MQFFIAVVHWIKKLVALVRVGSDNQINQPLSLWNASYLEHVYVSIALKSLTLPSLPPSFYT